MKILVIRGGAVGDFILTFPVLAALRKRFPTVRLEILGYPRIASLAVAGKLADEAHSIESPLFTPFFIPNGNLEEDLGAIQTDGQNKTAISGSLAPRLLAGRELERGASHKEFEQTRNRCSDHQFDSLPEDSVRFFASFDLIVSFLYDPQRIFQSSVARCSSARFIAGPHRPQNGSDHATTLFLKPLEDLGIFDADPEPKLVIPESLPAKTALGSGHWLAMHPGSGSESKNWPEQKWASLLEELNSTTNWNFLLIGGEAEGDRLTRLAKKLPGQRIQLASSLPLVQVAQYIKNCAFFIGHDSGISHLASALGLPGLILWGETVEEIWRPRSCKMKVHRHLDGLCQLPVRDVIDRIPALNHYSDCQNNRSIRFVV